MNYGPEATANLMVYSINLKKDPSAAHESEDLAANKAGDQRLAGITERLNKYQLNSTQNTSSRMEYCSVDQKHYPFWRPMFTSSLDNLVIMYVHTVLVI